MQYVYCLVKRAKKGIVFPRGLNGRKMRVVSFADIGAVVSKDSPDSLVGSAENVLVHQEVVGRTLELFQSVIPCQFGMWVADEAGIITLLRKNYSQLEMFLARLEGKVEVGITAILNGRQDKPVLSKVEGRVTRGPREELTAGERYLVEKREKYRGTEGLSEQARRLSRELNEAASPFWAAVRTEKKPVPQGVQLSLFYLIERDKLRSFTEAYEQFCQEAPHGKLLYTGPWPPYSFADVTLS